MPKSPWFVTTLLALGLTGSVGQMNSAAATSPRPSQGLASPASLTLDPATSAPTPPLTATPSLEAGLRLYEAGQYTQALHHWQQLLTSLGTASSLDRATLLTYQAMAQIQLGQYSPAEASLTESFQLLSDLGTRLGPTVEQQFLQAKTLMAHGNLQFQRGELETAIDNFRTAQRLYQTLGDPQGQFQSRLNLARVLHTQGRNHASSAEIQALERDLEQQQSKGHSIQAYSTVKTEMLRELGNLLRLTEGKEAGRERIEASLALATAQGDNGQIALSALDLANLALQQSQEPTEDYNQQRLWLQEAQALYQQVVSTSPDPSVRLQAWVNYSQALQENPETEPATIAAAYRQIDQALANTPLSRALVYARIADAETRLAHQRSPSPAFLLDLAQRLATAQTEAQQLQDQRLEAYALEQLARLYETTEQWAMALKVNQQAFTLPQIAAFPDAHYQLWWQQGRILRQQGQYGEAEKAYSQAVTLLKSLRGNLASLSTDTRFSFRKRVEPVYREYVALLLNSTPTAATNPVNPPRSLSPNPSTNPSSPTLDRSPLKQSRPKPSTNPQNPTLTSPASPTSTSPSAQQSQTDQVKLQQAIALIESLQLEELVNFFQANCIQERRVDANTLDPKAGVIYTIILDNRLEILLSQADQEIKHYSVQASANNVEVLTEFLRNQIIQNKGGFHKASRLLYDWLIQPLEADLAAQGVENLVFVLDRSLRQIPMGLLQNGQNRYLIEQYPVSVIPGLSLFELSQQAQQERSVLIGALSEARQEFAGLPNVIDEIHSISQLFPETTTLLLNQAFQTEQIKNVTATQTFPIVHFATHAKFSSKPEDTFILTWDDRLDINKFSTLLQGEFQERNEVIDLLVFSACETAEGDDRAVLGLAGLAVRTGARSTLATLWEVDDAGTALFMELFYQQLAQGAVPKAEAVRQAQLQLMQDPQFRHPFFWAPFVLVGNWL